MSTPDGGDATVTAVHRFGKRPVFRIVCNDGTETRATGTHRWEVIHDQRDGAKILTTDKIASFAKNTKNTWRLPAIKPIQYAPREVTIDPWLVGFLIGDGCLASKNVVGFATADPEIVERVQRTVEPQFTVTGGDNYGYNIVATVWGAARVRPDQHIRFKLGGYEANLGKKYLGRFKHREDAVAAKAVAIEERYGDMAIAVSLQNQLRNIGLMGKRADEKRIPEEYRYNTVEVRLEVLRGILDSDGHASEVGSIVLEQTSEQLAYDVQEMVEGLGGICRLTKAQRDIPNYRPSYRLNIRHPEGSSLFWLPRKKARATLMDGRSHIVRRIVDVVPDGEAEVMCIEVDSPRHLYLTDHALPTHNSKAGKRSPA